MKTLYSDAEEMFLVQLDEASGDLFLRVVIGGIAMYESERKMTSEMIEIFSRNPKGLLSFVKEMRLAG